MGCDDCQRSSHFSRERREVAESVSVQSGCVVKLSLHGDAVSIFESTGPFLELHANKWQRRRPSTFLAHLPIRRIVFLSVEML